MLLVTDAQHAWEILEILMNQLPQLLLKMVILAIFGTSMHDHELSADSFECFVYLRLGSSSCVVWESKF